jgi:hypothetical protein
VGEVRRPGVPEQISDPGGSAESGGEAGGEGEGAFGAVEDVEVVAGGVVARRSRICVRAQSMPMVSTTSVFSAATSRRVIERGERGAAHRGEALDLFQREHGHDAGDDRDGDAGAAAFFDETVIDGVVEEELGGDEVGAGVDLGFERGEIGFGRRCFGVFLGIAADAEAEVGVARFKEGDEVAGVAEAVFVGT